MIVDEYDFTNAIIGTDYFDQPIYSFDKMLKIIMATDYCTEDEAVRYLEYRIVEEEGRYTVLYRYE